ncbi:hypothetical protein ACFOUP_03610 [Belliella kenyensis]|uniref:LVIVD repeat-containing protein n=1 Tax=Belliella kenyensis TaxID=1472724 RepID=A0ABV8EI41_9BACT|nr:hypothetical protein [Belliella kenyensis]MCH7402303.1 hypothetical protein [Belliella kenyensis]MDN3603494.1 hypothetical protein [Belliella kenyensis]
MRKIYGLIFLVFIAFSCDNSRENPIDKNNIILNIDSDQLSARIHRNNAGVVQIVNPALVGGRISEDEIPSGKVPMALVAQALPPRYHEKSLRATHIDIDGDYAYVSYNKEGADFLGAIEIFDISEPTKPKITAQAIFTTADINAVKFSQGRLHIAAAYDTDAEPTVQTAAQYLSVSVANGNFTSGFVNANIAGSASVGVTMTADRAAVASGSDGVLALFDSNQETIITVPIQDLRDVTYGNSIVATLSGKEGVSLWSPSNLSAIGKISLDQDSPESKRTLDMGEGLLFTSEGANGAGVYTLPAGTLVERIPIVLNPEGVDAEDIVTNAVSYDKGLLMMANGGAGVSVVEVSDNQSLEMLGLIGLEGSSNFVKIKGKHLFVASGAGGLQILELMRKEDIPAPAVPVINCENTSPYTGSSNLNVNSNDNMRYTGSAALSNVNVNGSLTFCGSVAIWDQFNINSQGLFEMSGSLAHGRNSNSRMIINGHIKLNGSAVIYGDLVMNSNAKLEFVGENNSITVYGRVTKNNGATVIGDFKDTEGKLK